MCRYYDRAERQMSDRLIRLNCGICGGSQVEIRGRYPSELRRRVCPTCLMERMEQIQAISTLEYGQAYSVQEATNQESTK